MRVKTAEYLIVDRKNAEANADLVVSPPFDEWPDKDDGSIQYTIPAGVEVDLDLPKKQLDKLLSDGRVQDPKKDLEAPASPPGPTVDGSIKSKAAGDKSAAA